METIDQAESAGLGDGRSVGRLGLRGSGCSRVDPAESSDLSGCGNRRAGEDCAGEERDDGGGTHLSGNQVSK